MNSTIREMRNLSCYQANIYNAKCAMWQLNENLNAEAAPEANEF